MEYKKNHVTVFSIDVVLLRYTENTESITIEIQDPFRMKPEVMFSIDIEFHQMFPESCNLDSLSYTILMEKLSKLEDLRHTLSNLSWIENIHQFGLHLERVLFICCQN